MTFGGEHVILTSPGEDGERVSSTPHFWRGRRAPVLDDYVNKCVHDLYNVHDHVVDVRCWNESELCADRYF